MQTPARVLVVDDEPNIQLLLKHLLEQEGYRVDVVADAASARIAIRQLTPDVVVLDVVLPDGNGLEFCQELRRSEFLPVLMVSARGEDWDRILGLEVGADDYLPKPFNGHELVSRVRSLLRRWRPVASTASPEIIVRDTLRINMNTRRVEVGGRLVDLTPIEFSLLKVLAEHEGRALSRHVLLDAIWGQEYEGSERTVDSHIRNLRNKLHHADTANRYIGSVWGVGYCFGNTRWRRS